VTARGITPEARFADLVYFVFRMPVTDAGVVRLIKAAANNREEMFQLLTLAGKQPSLLYELDEDDVVKLLWSRLRTEGKRANLPIVCSGVELGAIAPCGLCWALLGLVELKAKALHLGSQHLARAAWHCLELGGFC
jgi:hypothetical protein